MRDSKLLRAYALKGDEAAFGELVRHYVDLVYSTALRRLEGDSALAEEVTQTVFLLLARKAALLGNHPALPGWLYQTAHHVAAKTQRSEIRRRSRELASVHVNMNDPDDSAIDQIMPMLNEALDVLGELDRLVVLLRFFLKKPMREIGLALGVSEAAAKMRVGRAVDRLRAFFVERGVVCSAAALALALTQKTANAAPATLTPKILSNLPTGTSSSLALPDAIKILILMSKAKSTSAVITALALIALFTAGIHHFSSGPTGDRQPKDSGATDEQAPSSPLKKPLTPPRSANSAAVPEKTGASSGAAQRLRAALSAPLRKSGISWPDEEVLQAVAAFTDRRAAFELLKGAVVHPEELVNGTLGVGDPEWLVKQRATSAMGGLAQDVPEVVPFLWDLFRSGNISSKADAFSTLKNIGFKSEDAAGLVETLPDLSSSPAMRLYVPQAISELIVRDPQGTSAAVASLENLLTHGDENVRLAAACALANQRLDQDQRISDMLKNTLTTPNSSLNHLGIDTLAKVGSRANDFVPLLLDLAKSTDLDYLRTDALRAVGAIRPSMAASLPEVAQVLAQDALARDVSAKLANGTAAFDDLTAALRLPQYTITAASRMGEMGAAASGAIPSLLQSLSGQSEENRERIVEAIRKIDPQVQIQRVEETAITAAMFEARIALGARNDSVELFVMNHAAQQTWWTRDEVLAFAKELASKDDTIFRAFATKIMERDPTLREPLEKLEN